jgi:hypothetical protein
MIAGETEYVLEDQLHDDFFGNKEKRRKRRAARKARRMARREKRRSDPKRIARRERRRTLFSKLGEAYRDIGGGQAIGGAVDTLLNKPIPTDSMSQGETPKDFSLGLGTDTKDAHQKEKKANYTPYIIGGGVLLGLGVVGVMLYKTNQRNYVRITKQ